VYALIFGVFFEIFVVYVEVFSLYAFRQQTYSYVRLKETKQGITRGNLPANYVSSVICCFTDKLACWVFFPVKEELFKHVIVQCRESYIKVILVFSVLSLVSMSYGEL